MRRVIKIDEEKCDGCGICAGACHEGAIAIQNGKAKLISEIYCDGLGDCIGECPRGAITFEMREAEPYDAELVKERLKAKKAEAIVHGGCPGSMAMELKKAKVQSSAAPASSSESELVNWPVQMRLVPAEASYLKGAHLLISADCTAFSCPTFHSDILAGKICLVGCPKLDDIQPYIGKLSEIITCNNIEKIDVAYMEVPCCGGLVKLVEAAIARAGKPIRLKLIKLSLKGKIMEIKEIFPK